MHFISTSSLKGAVNRLGECRAQPRLADFLIFKRAAIRSANEMLPSNGADGEASAEPLVAPKSAAAGKVTSGTRSVPFTSAIEELASAVRRPDIANWAHQPFFVPFAAKRASARGYKSRKYPSNGPDNTAAGWQTQAFSPVRLTTGTQPREWTIGTGTAQQLSDFLLVADSTSSERPRLLDAAVWWFRFTAFPGVPSASELENGFKLALGLTEVEATALFESSNPDTDSELSFGDVMADPKDYLPASPSSSREETQDRSSAGKVSEGVPAEALQELVESLDAHGFVFHPWQVAAFVTAVRTKPFVILAGISGTGKTKLPRLIADATGASLRLVPVLASWTDSSELIGYAKLDGTFVPGHLLRAAKTATDAPETQHFFVLDEMNIARVEYYFAEVLSHIEERRRDESGRLMSAPLAVVDDPNWASVSLPGNLAIVGSVNMDETTFGFSRKVLDRSFVIEFSSVELDVIRQALPTVRLSGWNSFSWASTVLTLAEHPQRESDEVKEVISALMAVNNCLSAAQLQVGYRVRDEVALFCLNARECSSSFTTRDASPVDPLDLALCMKVLPRIQGGGASIREVLKSLRRWAAGESPDGTSQTAGSGKAFPMCADRIDLMLRRLDDAGFTSFWM